VYLNYLIMFVHAGEFNILWGPHWPCFNSKSKVAFLQISMSARFLKTTAKYPQGDIGNTDTGAAHVAAATNFRSSFDFIPKF